MKNAPSSILLSWEAPEFIKQEKTILWDAAALGATVLLVIWGIWSGDIIFVALALLSGTLFWHFGKQEPKDVTFAIRDDGIQVNDLLYRYKNLTSFWIFHEPPHVNELVLRSKRTFIPLIHLNLGEEEPGKVREALKNLLEEKEEHYPLSHVLGHMLGY